MRESSGDCRIFLIMEDKEKRKAIYAASYQRHKEERKSYARERYKVNGKAYREANREAINENSARWRQANRELANARTKACIEAHPERQRASEEAYKRNHPDRIKKSRQTYRAKPKTIEQARLYRIEYTINNKDKLNAKAAMRRAAKMLATPKWIVKGELLPIYLAAAKLSRENGIEYHVDHIVPLRSDIVCGLHVPWNLQIIVGIENLSKGNRFWPYMP
jgi:hypothetical protein